MSRRGRVPPEQKLAQQVIITALQNTAGFALAGSTCRRLDIAEADRWFRDAGPDYRMICDMAGWDWAWIQDAYVSGKIDFEALCPEPRNGKVAA